MQAQALRDSAEQDSLLHSVIAQCSLLSQAEEWEGQKPYSKQQGCQHQRVNSEGWQLHKHHIRRW